VPTTLRESELLVGNHATAFFCEAANVSLGSGILMNQICQPFRRLPLSLKAIVVINHSSLRVGVPR